MEFRFLTDESPFGAICVDALRNDMKGARLSRLHGAYYNWLRPLMPLRARQWLQRSRGFGAADDGFFPHEFMGTLARALEGSDPLELIHPWPREHAFAFVLTHDVETAEGLRRAVDLAETEEELGFRSSFNLVPFGYPIDPGITRELVERGFEIGVHGYSHDGRLFASKRRFDSRVSGMNGAVDDYNAGGFRSPMVHRNLEWMQALKIDYDSSCFDADPLQAMPGGVGQIWPFIAGRFVELPYTLPQDHTLFVVLGESDARVWRKKLDYLAARSGMALMLTHPDYMQTRDRLAIYADFLGVVRDRGGFWHDLPREVARWWRAREGSSLKTGANGDRRVAGPGAAFGAVPARLSSSNGIPTFQHISSWTGARRGTGPVPGYPREAPQ